MTLEFPNLSRSYDEERKAVRFIGHDGMFEVRFLVEVAAISKSGREMEREGDCLAAFDALRSWIHDAARKAYANQRRDRFTLTAADLR